MRTSTVKQTAKESLGVAGDVAIALLTFTAEASDAFGPLKSASRGALYIANLVKGFKPNKEEWDKFGQYVMNSTARIVDLLPKVVNADQKKNIEILQCTLDKIAKETEIRTQYTFLQRFREYVKDPGCIQRFRTDLDIAFSRFQLGSLIAIGSDVSSAAFDHQINLLPVAEGASWNRDKVCLPKTREELLAKIWRWIYSIDDGSRIFFLTSVAGAGKSAIANSISGLCEEAGILASSFFFDVSAPERPQRLFSTIARHLAHYDPTLKRLIGQAIESEPQIPTAGWATQFQRLILEPCLSHPPKKPLVVIIDGLDEGYRKEIVDVLFKEVPKLPPTFRIILTSRDGWSYNSILSKGSHIVSTSINIHDKSNLDDVAIYVSVKLAEVAEWQCLDKAWPGPELASSFMKKAEGLFLWVAAVSDYLREQTVDPTGVLGRLLSFESAPGPDLPTEKKMDQIYSTILNSRHWEDKAFSEGYHILMGAIIAARCPLTARALQSLHHSILLQPVCKLLQPVSSLLTGVGKEDEPIQPIHLSFRDFVTARAQRSPNSNQFYVDIKKHNSRLALLCVELLNRELQQDIPGLGYLSGPTTKSDEIPKISTSISDSFRYSCRFWMNHVVEVVEPCSTLIDAMQIFLATYMVHWIEVSSSVGEFQGFLSLRKWMKRTLPEDTALRTALYSHKNGVAFYDISLRLTHMHRLEEAHDANREAVDIFRHLSREQAALFKADLARSLSSFSMLLSQLGYREDALGIMLESVQLYRQLAEMQPELFNEGLARSLCHCSVYLTRLGCRKDAVDACHESVQLYRQLAEEHPSLFNPDLALSLDRFSIRLADLGDREEALRVCRESVDLYKQLPKGRPVLVHSNLALCLNNLSFHLLEIGNHQEEALLNSRDAVELCRQEANERPAVFSSSLAIFLYYLADSLSECCDHEHALDAIRESVGLFRQLAKSRPALYTVSLADSLALLFRCLRNLKRQHEALQSIDEAMVLLRLLVKDRPSLFSARLAWSLNDLAKVLSDLDKLSEAEVAGEEELLLLESSHVSNEEMVRRRPIFCL